MRYSTPGQRPRTAVRQVLDSKLAISHGNGKFDSPEGWRITWRPLRPWSAGPPPPAVDVRPPASRRSSMLCDSAICPPEPVVRQRRGGLCNQRPAGVCRLHPPAQGHAFFPLSGGTIYSRLVFPYHQPERKPPFSIRFAQLYMISSYFLLRYFIFSCHVQSNLDQSCRQNYWFLHIGYVCNFFGFLVQSKSTPADL
jgi:hypothetical protein